MPFCYFWLFCLTVSCCSINDYDDEDDDDNDDDNGDEIYRNNISSYSYGDGGFLRCYYRRLLYLGGICSLLYTAIGDVDSSYNYVFAK